MLYNEMSEAKLTRVNRHFSPGGWGVKHVLFVHHVIGRANEETSTAI
jgi:hypothetical protein